MKRVPGALRFGFAVACGSVIGWGGLSAQAGRIEGVVVLAPSISARKARFRPYAEYGPGALPTRSNPDTNELTHVVIYIDSATAPARNSGTPVPALEQRDERFVPHVLPIVRGSVVSFPNRDPVFHNVFSLSSARSFDLGRYPQGASKSVRFDQAGIVQVFCHIHSDMSAVILVLENPYFAVPGATGHFVLENVPAGDYRVVAWHERIEPISRHVHVLPGQTANLDFTIPLPPEPDRP